ncbi:hypothetical protein Hdeb2414_s0006g00191871 [Helianthus debilis subsp. tardiflorus]
MGRGVNEPSRARLGSSSARYVLMELELELGSVRAYFSEPKLGSRVKPKARARLDSARAISRTTSKELEARLELVSTAIKRAKARLELGSPMLSSSLLYYIYKKLEFCLGSFGLASLNELCILGSSLGSITKRALFQARARAR